MLSGSGLVRCRLRYVHDPARAGCGDRMRCRWSFVSCVQVLEKQTDRRPAKALSDGNRGLPPVNTLMKVGVDVKWQRQE
jgi:hypothetical protein